MSCVEWVYVIVGMSVCVCMYMCMFGRYFVFECMYLCVQIEVHYRYDKGLHQLYKTEQLMKALLGSMCLVDLITVYHVL